MKIKIDTEESGQALVELSFAFVLLCIFVFGIVDFGRAIYDVEVMKNLAGEGSSMASRGTDTATTAATVANDAGSDISLNSLGCVIVSTVTNQGSGNLVVTDQAKQGSLCTSSVSKVGCVKGVGNCITNATIPAQAALALNAEPVGSSLYATEIYYTYTTITPLTAFLSSGTVPSQLYSVAYY